MKIILLRVKETTESTGGGRWSHHPAKQHGKQRQKTGVQQKRPLIWSTKLKENIGPPIPNTLPCEKCSVKEFDVSWLKESYKKF